MSARRFTFAERAVIAIGAAAFAEGAAIFIGALIWAHDRVEYQGQVLLSLLLASMGGWLVAAASLVRRRKRKDS